MVNKFLDIVRNNKNDIVLLYDKLIDMYRESCSLRIQLKTGQLKQLHLLKKLRRDIASLKYYLSQNKN